MTKALTGVLVSAALLGKIVPQQTDAPHLQAIRFWSFGDVTRVVIQTDGKYKLKSDQIEHPFRLYFDLTGLRTPLSAHRGIERIQVSDERVRQIRVAQVSPGTTRIVFDLQGAMEVMSSQLVNPDRLIIEIKSKMAPVPSLVAKATNEGPKQPARTNETSVEEGNSASLAGTQKRPSRAQPETSAHSDSASQQESKASDPGSATANDNPPVVSQKPSHSDSQVLGVRQVLEADVSRSRAPAPRPNIQTAGSPVIEQANNSSAPALRTSEATVIPNPAVAALARQNRSGERSLVRLFGLKMGRVVIDPGHGGHDTGTIGPNGLLEKDLVLDVALRLGALISGQMGADVVYTRSSDVFIPLEDRTKIANDQKADLFISIHANSSPERSATGVETYYFNLTSDKSGLNLATRENATATSSISDLNDLLHRAVLQTKLTESREFAQSVQVPLWNMSLRMNPASRNRGVRQAPFVVLIGATMPSVLAEVGFVSNTHDERLLKKTEQRQRIAESLFKGVTSYASSLSHTQLAKNNTH